MWKLKTNGQKRLKDNKNTIREQSKHDEWRFRIHNCKNKLTALLVNAKKTQRCENDKSDTKTRSQAVARIADRTASQQTLVAYLISDALPMKLHAVNSTSFRLLYRSTRSIRINTALIYAAPSQSLKNITPSIFRKLVRPVVPSDIPGDQYFEYVTANSIFILFLQISLTRVVIKWS